MHRPSYRTSFALPVELYKRLAHLAIDEGKTQQQIVAEALEEYLRRKEKKGGERK